MKIEIGSAPSLEAFSGNQNAAVSHSTMSKVNSNFEDRNVAAPSAALEAVLVESAPIPQGMVEVKGFDFDHSRPTTVRKLCDALKMSGFQATNLGLAIDRVNEMISCRSAPPKSGEEENSCTTAGESDVEMVDSVDAQVTMKVPDSDVCSNDRGLAQLMEYEASKSLLPGCTIWLSFTSNMISSGLREIFVYLAKHKMIDVIVTSAGGIEEDFVKCLSPTYIGDFSYKGKWLRQNGWNRIGNLLVPNENYCLFEDWLQPILDQLLLEQQGGVLPAVSHISASKTPIGTPSKSTSIAGNMPSPSSSSSASSLSLSSACNSASSTFPNHPAPSAPSSSSSSSSPNPPAPSPSSSSHNSLPCSTLKDAPSNPITSTSHKTPTSSHASTTIASADAATTTKPLLPPPSKESNSIFLQNATEKATSSAGHEGVLWTPSKLIDRLGKEINDERSLYYWCHKNKIPVFCPGLTDGSLGDNLFFHAYRNPGLVIDVVQDIKRINDIAIKCRKSGMIILGGGIAKHHTCNANLMRNGADFAVYINTGSEYDGSDSGAKPDEAVSWGKIRSSAEPVKVVGDATILFSLLVAATFAS